MGVGVGMAVLVLCRAAAVLVAVCLAVGGISYPFFHLVGPYYSLATFGLLAV